MAYDAATGTVVLFGGRNAHRILSDTWTWNSSTWTEQVPASSPSARYGQTLAYDATTRTVVLFGGFGSGLLGDTWTWNGSTWTEQAPSTSPPARYLATSAYDAATGTVALFGGISLRITHPFGDTWTWDGSTWTRQAPASHPAGRYDTESAYDAAIGKVVLSGGLGNDGVPGDTWTWG